MHRWRFISEGGEDNETPMQAASRDLFEETGVTKNYFNLAQLHSFLQVYILRSHMWLLNMHLNLKKTNLFFHRNMRIIMKLYNC